MFEAPTALPSATALRKGSHDCSCAAVAIATTLIFVWSPERPEAGGFLIREQSATALGTAFAAAPSVK